MLDLLIIITKCGRHLSVFPSVRPSRLVPDRRLYIKGFLDGSCLNRDDGGFDSFDGGGSEVICGLGRNCTRTPKFSSHPQEKFAKFQRSFIMVSLQSMTPLAEKKKEAVWEGGE